MGTDRIVIRGAREHNLKNIDLELPRDRLIVFTGISGSGKSSLAFDTIYAEGQRRYVESLSTYARQFLGQVEKPDVESIEGLSPAISIEQKSVSHNPRSTVGTTTEVYDYLRLLYARVGIPHCPKCGRTIAQQTSDQITEHIEAVATGKKVVLMAPLIRARKGEHRALFESKRQEGFLRVRVDGEVKLLDEDIKLEKNAKHDIDLVVDRLKLGERQHERLAESVELALGEGVGKLIVVINDKEELLFSEHLACPVCGISIEEPEPAMFSFNSPRGACPACHGLGVRMEFDPEL
ncbi:MAG: excinuclease ABC subunit UvrA, partial [Methermicoccaceae archaeon]